MKKIVLCLGLALSFTISNVYATVNWLSYNIRVNNHKLHYYQSGHGDAVFLLTGYATTANFWNKNFVDCLAQNHTVYLVDYWGINTDEHTPGDKSIKAMADDMFMLSKVLHVKKPVYIGWSMGGAVAQQISFDYPDEIGKVVLIAPLTIHNQPNHDNVSDNEAARSLRTYNDVLNYVFDNNLYDYHPKDLSFYKRGLFDAHDKLFISTKISDNQVFALNSWTSDPETKQEAKNSAARYLFLVPLQDKMLIPWQTIKDAKTFPHSTIVKFEGSGHNISMQAPAQACEQINNFID